MIADRRGCVIETLALQCGARVREESERTRAKTTRKAKPVLCAPLAGYGEDTEDTEDIRTRLAPRFRLARATPMQNQCSESCFVDFNVEEPPLRTALALWGREKNQFSLSSHGCGG